MEYPEHIQYSIDLLRRAERLALKMQPERGFWLAFSGGKDSQCIYHLAKLAGVKFEAHYAVTTLDHPELVHFIRRCYPDVIWDHPKRTFLQLCLYKKMLPTMQARFCCQELKESAGVGHCTIIGVRKAESSRRAKREELERVHKDKAKRRKVILMDNNILAAGDYAKEQLQKIIDRGYKVDFNQALDARLVTDEFAALLAQISWLESRIRFGCDTPAQVKECERAMELINSYGYKGQYFLYTMLNDNFNECYERINHWWKKNQELVAQHHKSSVYPYAQPYRDPYNPARSIPQWQKDLAGWVNKKMLFEKISFEEFEPRKGFRCVEYIKARP